MIWVSTVCSDLSVLILRIFTAAFFTPDIDIFSFIITVSPIYSLPVSYCTTPNVNVVASISKMLKFYIKAFCVIDQSLSGELSCMQTGIVKVVFIYSLAFTQILMVLHSLLLLYSRPSVA